MTLQYLLDQKNISKYQLSKMSGVPKTTIMDICSGKSEIERCSAGTIYKIALALHCSMEDLMTLTRPSEYDPETGRPMDKRYLECGLPPYLQISLEQMKKSWEIVDRGERDLHWDLYWCELNADINSAEIDQSISVEQAWYLRTQYLRMEKEGD